MPTFTALTTLTSKADAERLSGELELLTPEPYGVGVFEVEDGSETWEVGGYFLERPDEVALALLAASCGARPFAVSEVPDKDWVAEVKRELAPIEAGRFFLYGSHDADKVPENCVPLLIEAAMAFGTGHHGTTKGCLIALDKLANEGFVGRNVADIGCGTAVLAMAAAKIWPYKVLASDIDEVATDTARANIALNGLAERIEVVTCAGFDHPVLHEAAPFDLVLANILKGPLVDLAPDMDRNIAAGGYAILSGLLNTQADDVINAYTAENFELVDQIILGEWSSLTLRKC